MVETRRGSRTDGAVVKTEKVPKNEESSRPDEVKTEPIAADIRPSVEDAAPAAAGDKHDRRRSLEDARKRQRKEDTVAEIKKEENKDGENDDDDDASTILEKGNIYFFFRARVNIDEPKDVGDVARTYIVLKPQDKDDDGTKGNGRCRLLALPKKVLPRTGRDRFMAFVLKAGASYAELESEFLTGSETDKADEEKHYAPATAFGEGVYAIIGTRRESHLAYVLTVPETLGDVQEQLGLASKQGCFIVSAKNPAFPMPGGAKMVGGGPDYPQEIKDAFRSLRWAPLRPEHLDYAYSHLLLIGESKGTDAVLTSDRAGRELSAELEELADDDIDRMRRLGSTEAEAVFASLHAKDQAVGQPELATTFG